MKLVVIPDQGRGMDLISNYACYHEFCCYMLGIERSAAALQYPPSRRIYPSHFHVTKFMIQADIPMLMQNIPVWIGWFHYLDFLHYAWASLMLNEFEHQPATFIDNQTVQSNLFMIILLIPAQCVALRRLGL